MAGGIWGDNRSHYWLEGESNVVVLWLVTPASEGQKSNPRLVLWRERINLSEEPCRTIAAGNVVGLGYYYLEDDGLIEKRRDDGKPPYRVPSMAEIGAVPQNGLTLVSTFSGCGGSCLGFRMAGFETLWASEFIPAACQVYKFNHLGVPVDTRDIRDVKPKEILKAVGMEKGEIDVLEGSPPCVSFSTAGKREKKWGQVVKYLGTTQRVDDLFFEFVRILDGLQPRAFIAENVSGLVKGKAKGYFKLVLAAMKAAGYRVSARLLDAQWLGVPQSRQRVIFVGMRADLKADPAHPLPLGYRYSVSEAIPWVIKQRHGGAFGEEEWIDGNKAPAQTVGTNQASGNNINDGAHKIEVRIVQDTRGLWPETDHTNRPVPCVRQSGTGQLYVETKNGVDLQKVEPESDDGPSQTISQTGGKNPSIAAVTHPIERRKFSIAELKRICAFPDDFELTGSYAQQWARLGLSVPPVMAFWIARSIRETLFKLDGRSLWPHDLQCLIAGLDYEHS